ncbi:hypothetical protein UlMin_045504 [Ulmus minor]
MGSIGSDDSNKEEEDPIPEQASKPKKKLPKFPKFREETNLKNPIFKLGQIFTSNTVFKQAVKEHAIREGRRIRFTHNEPGRVRAVCTFGSCPWKIFASRFEKNSVEFQVKSSNLIHECGKAERHPFLDYKWIEKNYTESFKDNKRFSAAEVINSQYFLLWDYCEELKKKNPSTTTKIKVEMGTDGAPIFHCIYICLAACKKGFLEACKPLIGLNGCHIKGPFRDQLLSAVGADANNCMYPIAYSIVEQENTEAWG